MSYVVNYGQHRISYSVEFRDRTTMEIAVLPDGTVRVKAPLGAEDSRIREKIHRRAGWIVKQQRYFEQFAIRTPKRQYLGGEDAFVSRAAVSFETRCTSQSRGKNQPRIHTNIFSRYFA